MGLFDSLVSGALRGVLGEGQSQALPGLLSKVLGGTELGSISGLLAQLQQGGLDRQVASWLGNGANMAVRPDQLRAALGEERLQQIGSAAGVSTDTLLGALAQFLPGAVDRMSPTGVLDESASSSDGGATDRAPGGSLEDQIGLKDMK